MLRMFFASVAVLVSAGAAGSDEPLVIRHAIMEGVAGKAFYSTVEQGFRFIGDLAVETREAMGDALGTPEMTQSN